MQPFAARETKERAQAQALETLFDQKSGRDDRAPSDVLGRIEVEYDDVGLVEMLRTRSPDVQLERADLHETEQRGQPVDHRVRFLVRLDRDPRDHVGNADADVLLIEALLSVALGTTQQRQRPLLDERQRVRRNLLPVAGELPFRDAGVGEQHLVRARELDGRPARSTARVRLAVEVASDVRRTLRDDVVRRLVLAQPAKTRVTQAAVGGPFAER